MNRTCVRRLKHHPILAKWAWHYRTLRALRTHFRGRTGERLAEPFEAMEPPSLHCEDLADELYDRDLAAALPSNPAEALWEIEYALQRITAGTYGKSETTGRTIAAALLRAMPWRRDGKISRPAAPRAAEVGGDPAGRNSP